MKQGTIAKRLNNIVAAMRAIETLGGIAKNNLYVIAGKAITDDDEYRKLLQLAGSARESDKSK